MVDKLKKKIVFTLLAVFLMFASVEAQEYYDLKFLDSCYDSTCVNTFYGMTVVPTGFMGSDKYFIIWCANNRIVVDRVNVFGDFEDERVSPLSCSAISQAVVWDQGEVLFFVKDASANLLLLRFNITEYMTTSDSGIHEVGAVDSSVIGSPAISNIMTYKEVYKGMSIGDYSIAVAYRNSTGYYVAWDFYDPATHTFNISNKKTFRWDSGLSSVNNFFLKASQGHCFYWTDPNDLCSFQIIFEGKSNQNSNYTGIYVREAHYGTWGWEFIDKGTIGFDTSYGFWFRTPGIDTWGYFHPYREGYSPYLERTIFFRQRYNGSRAVGADFTDYKWNFVSEYAINREGTNAFMPKAFEICRNCTSGYCYSADNVTFPNQTFVYFLILTNYYGTVNVTITDYNDPLNNVTYTYTISATQDRWAFLRFSLPSSTVNITVCSPEVGYSISVFVDVLPDNTPFFVSEGVKEGTLAFAFPVMHPYFGYYFGGVYYLPKLVNTNPYVVQTARVVAPPGVSYGSVTVFVYDAVRANCTFFRTGNEVVLTNLETGGQYKYTPVESANRWVDNVCLIDETFYGAYGYNFTNIPTGYYKLEVSRSGYEMDYPSGQEFYLDTGEDKYIIVTARPKNVFDIIIYTYKLYTSERIPAVWAVLYFANGTAYPGTRGYWSNYVWWRNIPNDTYYFTVEADGYYRYTSSLFYLDSDRTFTVYLRPGIEKITLYGISRASISDNIPIQIVSENIVFPRRVKLMVDNRYWRDILGTPYYCTDILLYNETQDFTIEASWECLKEGSNSIYLDADTFTSSRLNIEIYKTVVPPLSPGINISTLVPVPSEYETMINIFFTPMFISTIVVFALAAYIEYKVKSNGVAFILVVVAGIIILSIFGIYPAWVVFMLAIIASAIGVYYVREVQGGK